MSDKSSQSRWLLIFLLLVATGSLIAIIALHANQDLQWLVQILSAPFVVALLGIVVQALLWEQRKQHEQFQQEREHALQLGAVSGIAERVFDGYAEFCEEYLKELYNINKKLAEEGPSPACKEYADQLRETRLGKRYYAWIPVEIDQGLSELEGLLWGIGFKNETIKEIKESGYWGERHHFLVDQVFEDWTKLMYGNEERVEEPDIENRALISNVMLKLKEYLDVEQLNRLRRRLVDRAISSEGVGERADASSEGA
ncbi:MAG: hypothetical protein GVY16_05935 [Planctomycetes bacterium]|nr:hypothetical protein [Planctomycetota bacterium]